MSAIAYAIGVHPKALLGYDTLGAFTIAQLPSDGTGLVRLEFVVSDAICARPKALRNYDTPDAFSFAQLLGDGIGLARRRAPPGDAPLRRPGRLLLALVGR